MIMFKLKTKALALPQLLGEIDAAAIPALAAATDSMGERMAVYELSGDEETGDVYLRLYDHADDVDADALEAAVAKIVAAHVPQPPPEPPPTVQERVAEALDEATANTATTVAEANAKIDRVAEAVRAALGGPPQ